jgi:hypothetical protein
VSCKCVLDQSVNFISVSTIFLLHSGTVPTVWFFPHVINEIFLLVLRDITQSDIRTCFTWGDNSCYLSKRFSIQIHVEIVSTLSLYNSIVYTCKT